MNRSKKRVLLDCDGIICDFVTAFLREAHVISGLEYQHDDVKTWDLCELEGLKVHEDAIYSAVKRSGWSAELEPYEGALEAVERLKAIGEVTIVTSPLTAPTFCFDRVRWLERHFGIKSRDIIFAKQKHFIDGTCLIDDRVENVQDWMAEKRRKGAVLFTRPWNENVDVCHPKLLRSSDWDEIISFVDAL